MTTGLLVVGFLALAFAVLLARSSPPEGYEPSIYAATPVGVWVGIAIAIVFALPAALDRVPAALRAASLCALGLGIGAIAAMPTLRGYAYYGMGDALSHLGWVRDMESGVIGASDIMYPGLHGGALLLDGVVGVGHERALLFVVISFAACFLVFVTVLVSLLVADPRAGLVGLLSAGMLLPINNVSAHLNAHPSTLAILFAPFPLTLLALYLRLPSSSGSAMDRLRSASPIGMLVALCSVAIVFVHPQQAANLFAVFATIAGLQFLRRRMGWGDPLRPIYVQTGFLAVVLAAWTAGRERAQGTVSVLIESLLTGQPQTDAVAQRGDAITDIGGSLEELFVLLFLVSTIYAVLATLVTIAALTGRLDDRFVDRDVTLYLGLGTVPVVILFVLFFVAGVQTMYFRYIGFGMAIATVLGAVTLLLLVDNVGRLVPASRPTVTAFAIPFLIVLLALSLVTLYPSPFVYQTSGQVTEGHFDGFEAAFERGDDELPFHGVREGPGRFEDATLGTGEEVPTRFERRANAVEGTALEVGLATSYSDPAYVVVTDGDHYREVETYQELRYSEEGLATVGDDPGVNRVQHNGVMEVYLVEPRTPAPGPEEH